MSCAEEPKRAILTAPYPPSVNHYWRHVVMGGSSMTLISKRGREYRAAVVRALPPNLTPLRHRLRVTVTLCRKDRRIVDLDNFGKALLDAITAAGVWADDSLIDDLRFIRGPPGDCSMASSGMSFRRLPLRSQHERAKPPIPGEAIQAGIRTRAK